ncbi:unnamed protein product, partial [Ectocarpus sp. 13 AM-2016]
MEQPSTNKPPHVYNSSVPTTRPCLSLNGSTTPYLTILPAFSTAPKPMARPPQSNANHAFKTVAHKNCRLPHLFQHVPHVPHDMIRPLQPEILPRLLALDIHEVR